MRMLTAILALIPSAVLAQEQEAANPPAAADARGGAVYDMVTADRETAWRINRVTGEIIVCRIDTTGSLDGVRARCSPAGMETGAGGQQSQAAPPRPAAGRP